jgi:lipoprotein-anchoring transpeptidase ErfK/SrfK
MPMNNIRKNNFGLLLTAVGLSVGLSAMQSCNNQNTNKETTTVTKTDSLKRPDNSTVDQSNITMPVLNALFFEDGFENDLKAKLQLSAAQIQQLKDAASASVADLNEDAAGSSKEAAKRSAEQISAIVGKEKANQLYRLINERYANGDNGSLMPKQPNAIPTDTRIVVNAPAFRMDVFQDGKLLKTYRVGIGYPEFPLPTGMRKAETIIFNPTWTPPDEPWVKGKVEAGKKVAAGSKLNPLGPIKIPIGLPSLIHGGKAVAKLGNFASHGCVGMTNGQVQDFTGLLTQIEGTPISADSILGYEKSKTKTKTVKLEKPMAVELRYETIVAENGILHIYRDVYEHGTNTLDNAKSVLNVYGIKYESLNATEKDALNNALAAMNLDSKGNAIAGGSDNINDSISSDKKEDAADEKKARVKKGKVTRAVVGQTEIAVQIAALANKGYPAPVNYDIGTAVNTAK